MPLLDAYDFDALPYVDTHFDYPHIQAAVRAEIEKEMQVRCQPISTFLATIHTINQEYPCVAYS
jgi:hypothetical protein